MRKAIWLFLVLFTSSVCAQNEDAVSLVKWIYSSVTTEKGETPDWDLIKSSFYPGCVIAMRISKSERAVFSLEDWVDDFNNFIVRSKIVDTGFRETPLQIEHWELGDIARVDVLYTSQIPGHTSPKEGLDSFHLIRVDGQWKVLSIINEIPSGSRLLPSLFER